VDREPDFIDQVVGEQVPDALRALAATSGPG
jgi:hypothetical protein